MATKEKRITLITYPDTFKLLQKVTAQTGMPLSAIGRRAVELGLKEIEEFGLKGRPTTGDN